MITVAFPEFRVDVETWRQPGRRFKKRSFGMNRTGLWGSIYPTAGTGIMLSTSSAGWALSASVMGRAAVVGWVPRR